MKKLLVFITIVISQHVYAQLTDGTVAPDFTITDLNGTSHNLHSYLDSDKTVFLEIFAAHCPTCWNYHLTHRLKNMHNMYGPNGSDEIMVLALEYDENNDGDAFIGIGDPWQTQGDWLEGTPFPLFNVEGSDRSVFTDYNVTFYPVVYKICPDKIIERVSTSETESQLYQKVQICQNSLSIDEKSTVGNVYVDQHSKSLIVDQHQHVTSLKIMDVRGQLVKAINSIQHSLISLSDLKTGIYIVELQTESGPVMKKLYLN
ncbi:MAG: T9SS type A sorting domain-containing protein [Flavobacteriales bacterium]|nr:T9SS type A sorting domain-containing protein [Flavobacteriales bacterium]